MSDYKVKEYGGISSKPDLIVGSKKYVEEVYKRYNLIPYDYFKPTSLSDLNNPHVIEAMSLYNKIKSGDFIREKNISYKDNYIKMMENMGVKDDKLYNIIKRMPLNKFIQASDMFPSMRDYYKYLKGMSSSKKGNNVSDVISDFYNELKASLIDMGYKIK